MMQRNNQLDFFRGLLLIVIVIDHLFTSNNIIRVLTDGFFGWFSAAEGFVFISGLVAGLVYSYKYNQNKPIKAPIFRRALSIYKYHILSILFLLFIVNFNFFVRAYWLESYDILFRSPSVYFLWFSSFLYQPGYFDVLPMYIIFMLLVPLAIKSLENKRYLLVCCLSIAVYLLGYSNILLPFYNSVGNKLVGGYFNILCWQLIFFGGLIIGHLMYHEKININKNRLGISIALTLAIILFILKRLSGYLATDSLSYISRELTDKSTLKPLRLINVAAIIVLVAWIATRFKGWFTYKPVCRLGMYSLQVFTFQILVIILFKPFDAYFNSLLKIRIIHDAYFYPISTAVFIFFIVPALYMVAYLSQKNRFSFKRIYRGSAA